MGKRVNSTLFRFRRGLFSEVSQELHNASIRPGTGSSRLAFLKKHMGRLHVIFFRPLLEIPFGVRRLPGRLACHFRHRRAACLHPAQHRHQCGAIFGHLGRPDLRQSGPAGRRAPARPRPGISTATRSAPSPAWMCCPARWRKNADGTYSGTLYSLPDRGPNGIGSVTFSDYAGRVSIFDMNFTPYTSSHQSAGQRQASQHQLKLTQTGGFFFKDFNGNVTTGLDPGARHNALSPRTASAARLQDRPRGGQDQPGRRRPALPQQRQLLRLRRIWRQRLLLQQHRPDAGRDPAAAGADPARCAPATSPTPR